MNRQLVILLALGAATLLGLILRFDVRVPGFVMAGAGAVALLGLLLTSLFRPDIPLYVLTAYLPFSKLLAGDFGGAMTALNLTNLLFAVVFLALIFSRISRGVPRFVMHPLHIAVALFVSWACVSYLVTGLGPDAPPGYASGHLDELKRLLDPFVVYFLFFLGVRSAAVWKNVTAILMTVVAVVASLAAWDYLDVGAGASLERSRIGGVIGQPNYLGAFIVYYVFLFAAHWLESIRRPAGWLLVLPFLMCFRGMMVTFSRGAYLAFGLGVLGLAFFKRKRLAVAATAAFVLLILNPWLLPSGIRYRLDKTYTGDSEPLGQYASLNEEHLDKSAETRLVIWRGGLDMVRDHPYTGVGLGEFSNRITAYADLPQNRDAHNAYLIIAAELGVPALLFFLTAVASIFWVTRRVYRRHPDRFVRATALGFLGGLSALLMANMFGSRVNTMETAGYVWVLAALMARADLDLGSRLRPSSRSHDSGRT